MWHALDLALTCIYPRCCCGYCYYFVVMVFTTIVTYVLLSVLNVVAVRTPGERFRRRPYPTGRGAGASCSGGSTPPPMGRACSWRPCCGAWAAAAGSGCGPTDASTWSRSWVASRRSCSTRPRRQGQRYLQSPLIVDRVFNHCCPHHFGWRWLLLSRLFHEYV